ncbi:MAG: SGNH/GDSL hydrolase family protein [Huintestinicola sp.]
MEKTNRKKFVSIIGDSISTYEGFNPHGYSVFYDNINQQLNGVTSVSDTWWAKVNQYLNADLCVNNSYSGSRVSGNGFPSANCQQRLMNLHTPSAYPDIILIYIGFNDFGNGIKIKKSGFRENYCDSFYDSYSHMIKSIKSNYPKATIICATLLKGYFKDDIKWHFPENFGGVPFDDYNDAIRKAAKKEKIRLADIAKSDARYETLDGTHPTNNGHLTIAEEWISCLKEMGF